MHSCQDPKETNRFFKRSGQGKGRRADPEENGGFKKGNKTVSSECCRNLTLNQMEDSLH